MLEEQNRIVVADRGLHQALCVGRRAACHDLDARHGVEISLKSLTVLGSQLSTDTARPPNHRQTTPLIVLSTTVRDCRVKKLFKKST